MRTLCCWSGRRVEVEQYLSVTGVSPENLLNRLVNGYQLISRDVPKRRDCFCRVAQSSVPGRRPPPCGRAASSFRSRPLAGLQVIE